MYGFVLWLQCHFLSSCEIGRKTFTLSWCVSFEFKQTSNISLWCIEDPVCTVCRNGSTFSCWVLDNINSFYCRLFFPPVAGVIPPLSITSEINKAETLEDKKYAQRCFLWGVQWGWEAMMSLNTKKSWRSWIHHLGFLGFPQTAQNNQNCTRSNQNEEKNTKMI